LQRLAFKAARKGFEQMRGQFKGTPEYLVAQLVRSSRSFIESPKLVIPSLFHQEPLRKTYPADMNVELLVQHLLRFVMSKTWSAWSSV